MKKIYPVNKTSADTHPLAKIAFNSDKFYDLQKAFSVSQNSLENAWKSVNSGIPINLHQQITGNQNRLYSAFAKKAKF
ncbi:hypothetical protein [Confluentibacter sediminis]|uniref:hypothetical protein n=1 Tax=Confluentibacter sediminis TaxID=2219045 RepID=UPI000DAD7FE4|nr:hypothetical protein [Confluentibacter sediminis]